MAKYAQLTATGLPHGVLLTIKDSTGKQVSNLYPEANANAPDNRPRFADGTGAIDPAAYVPNGTYTVAYSGGSQTVVVSGASGTPADSMFIDLATQAELDAAGTAASGTYATKAEAAAGGVTGFSTVAGLLASTQAAFGAGTRWTAGGYLYREAASSASDQHVTTAGGVKLYVTPVFNFVELAAWGVDSSTTSVTGALLQAAATAQTVILPPSTLNIVSKPTVDANLLGTPFKSALNMMMASGESLEMAAGRSLRGVKITSPYHGPASAADAVDATAGGKYDYGSRSVRLNANCYVSDYEHEYAAAGLFVAGTGVVIERFSIHDIHHYKGWGAAIHRADGTASSGHVRDGFITDCDRGTETETGASFNLTERVTYTRIGPFGYTGQPAFYEVYTFVLDAHSHAGEGACVGNVYRDCRVIDSMGAITTVRSSGSNDSDMPTDNLFEDISIEGFAGVTGYDAVYLQGHRNKVKGLKLKLGSGVNAKMLVTFAGGGSSDNECEISEAIAYALPLVSVGSDNTTQRNRVRATVLSLPTTGSGFLCDVYGPQTDVDLTVKDVTGTSGYLRFNSPATRSQVTRLDYTVATAETFAQVVQVVGTAHVKIRGVEGYNYATVPPKDIATSGGVTHLNVQGANIDRSGGTSIDLGGASVDCVVKNNDLGDGKVNDAGTNNQIDRQGDVDFDCSFGTDPAVAAFVAAGGSVAPAAASKVYIIERRAARRLSLTKLIWMVGTSSGNYDIALLDSAGTVLWAKGSTAVPASGVVTETFTAQTIKKGARFYYAIVFDNTTVTVKGVTVATIEFLKSLTGTGKVLNVSSTFPLPTAGNVLAVGSTTADRVPLIASREA